MCSFRGSTKRTDKHILNEFRQSSTDMEMLDHTIRITPCKLLNGHHSIRQTSCLETHRQRIPNTTQMKVTKMLLVISTVFVILNLPSYVIRVWIFIVSVSKCVHIYIQYTIYNIHCLSFRLFSPASTIHIMYDNSEQKKKFSSPSKFTSVLSLNRKKSWQR